jgi:mono/diheme cytochrome c family protein
MAYSRAYETYASTENLRNKGINYTATPVPGTIARGDMMAYKPGNDSAGLLASAAIRNPLPPLDAKQYLDAARLYMINCAICHGDKLDGNGPLYKDGNGPYKAAPANLLSADIKTRPEGTLFHVITHGKGAMGSYASQLSTSQRWMIVHYLKEKMGGGSGDTTGAKAVIDTTRTAATDTTNN